MLLTAMAMPYAREGKWPLWGYVQDQLDRHEVNATEVLHSLPVVGSQGAIGPSYGVAWYRRPYMADDARPALTVAAAVHLPELDLLIAQPFLRVLHIMIKKRLDAPLSTQEVTRPEITRSGIRQALPNIGSAFMDRLPDILNYEPFTMSGMSIEGEEWKRPVPRSVLEYKDVHDLESYVGRTTELVNRSATTPTYGSATVVAPQPPIAHGVYVEESLIDELENKIGSTQWNLDKLIRLLRELNSNYGDGHPYACHALLRAILDHVPPILVAPASGKPSFDQVVSNRSWSKTDQAYVTKLKDFRAQGDDVLHRQIHTSADLIKMDDVPPRAWLNVLLRACIDDL
ncbi:hypothetical protein AB0H18_47225 [Streptomyces sp. NPDC020766]|uniref:hypothetical protein n=1 Tax=Streptomyces sp. NPDC020766 TaxID=3155011 RepID=UPI00340D3EFC